MSSASAKVSAPTATTMKSWISTRRAAWAPPPKSWISGKGSRTGRSSASDFQRGTPSAAARAWATASETAIRALPPRRDLFGVPSRAISAAVDRGLIGGVAPGERLGDFPVHRGDRADHVIAAEAPCRHRGGRPPRPTRSRHQPARSRGRPRRRPASPRPRPSGGRANPIRAGRTPAAIVVLLTSRSPGPGVAYRGERRRRLPDQRHGDAADALPLFVAGDVLDRRLAVHPAREEVPEGARRRALRGRRAPPNRRRGKIGVAQFVEGDRADSAARAGTARHLRRRWLRQKARSKAGSPYQAHSASRKTGPCGPVMMFFGLTSPWTRATRRRGGPVGERVQFRPRSPGWRRAVARR